MNRSTLLLLWALIVYILVTAAFGIRVNAAESDTGWIKDFDKFDSDSLYGKAYGFSLRYRTSGSANGYVTENVYEFSIVSDRPIFVCLEDAYSTNGPIYGAKLFYLKEDGTVAYLNGGEDAGAVVSNYDWVCRRDSDGSLVNSSHYDYGKRPVLYVQETFFANIGDMSCTSYVFDSVESAKAYYEDGDLSGIVSRPPVDYSGTKHDFSKDTYDADIPVPELSNFHHNGFTVNNASDDLYIDIVVESQFLGAKHYNFNDFFTADNTVDFGTKDDNYDICVDTSWTYATHYYNITELSDIAVNQAVINIKDLWGVDNEGALIEDFKKWSDEYPSHQKLPDYSFFKYSNSAYMVRYAQRHLYSYSSERSDSVQLSASGQAQSTFYVRFYDKHMNCGRWVYYTFRDGQYFKGTLHQDELAMGTVGSNLKGDPVKDTEQVGRQDSNGNVDFSVTNDGTSAIDSSDFLATLRSLVDGIGDIPDLIGDVFSFLPWWVLGMIAAGIGAIVVLRFLGR